MNKLKIWCQKILPLVYDDSLSYYEVLAKVAAKINEIIDGKQDTLVSGTNIKTVNGSSIVGEGNVDISGGVAYSAGTGIDITSGVISVDSDELAEDFLTKDEAEDTYETAEHAGETYETSVHAAATYETAAHAASTYATKTEVNAKEDTLTGAKLNAVNSGITAEKVASYDAYEARIAANASSIATLNQIKNNTLRYVVSEETDTSVTGITWKVVTWSDGTKELFGITDEYSKTLVEAGAIFETSEFNMPNYPANTFSSSVYHVEVDILDANAQFMTSLNRASNNITFPGQIDILHATRVSASTTYTFKLQIYAIGK